MFTGVAYLIVGVAGAIWPGHWDDAAASDQFVWAVLLIAGGLVVLAGLRMLSRAPIRGATLVLVGGVVGALPIFWALLPLLLAVALVVLSVPPVEQRNPPAPPCSRVERRSELALLDPRLGAAGPGPGRGVRCLLNRLGGKREWRMAVNQSMADDQRHGRIFGVLFVITFITSIPAYLLFQDILDDPAAYITEDGKDNVMYLAVLLEFILILANVGTAVALYPIAKRQNQALAIGYVAARIIESVFIAAGMIFILGVVSLRQDAPDAADLAVSLAALKDWTFLSAQGSRFPSETG